MNNVTGFLSFVADMGLGNDVVGFGRIGKSVNGVEGRLFFLECEQVASGAKQVFTLPSCN